MSLTLIGKKRGMTRIYDKKTGKAIPCTIIEIEPNVVVQKKTSDKDGYNAVQTGAVKRTKKNLSKPLQGHFDSKKVEPKRFLMESKLSDGEEFEVGKEIGVDYFQEGAIVDIHGTSKGKGYQGVIKRHGVARLVSSHGCGPVSRHIGSSGSLTAHGRVQKNKKGAGQMGAKKVVVEKLHVIQIDQEMNALVVKGAVPGPNSGVVYVRKAIKTVQ